MRVNGSESRMVELVETMLKLHKDSPKAKTPQGEYRDASRIPTALLARPPAGPGIQT
jgi:hypothetical protein